MVLWLGRDGTSTARMGGWTLLEAVRNGLIWRLSPVAQGEGDAVTATLSRQEKRG